MTPEKIGRYEIKQEIGRGGMATVYEAYDPRFERTVALKMLPREFMHEAEFRARFTREAKTIATLEHPAIVPVYDFGEENGQPFLVMRLMTGGSLSDRLAEGPIAIDEAAVILKRLGSALDRAHSMGIIHRDLKPSNVLFDQYGDAFLADFGIVHVSSSTNALTASGSLVGTPTYMSPEQVYGDKTLDGRSDIYALGVILFQMLTGNTPYDADTPARMMMKHVMDPVPEILTVRPDLPPACNEIINKAMAKERDERFASATDLSSALTAITERGLEKPTMDRLEAELSDMKAELMEEAPPPVTAARSTAV
ncbi:MAG: serine/threonine-protein kinase, partial [Chloroflexota bacterium]